VDLRGAVARTTPAGRGNALVCLNEPVEIMVEVYEKSRVCVSQLLRWMGKVDHGFKHVAQRMADCHLINKMTDLRMI
jgi:hypothetical protein